METEADFRIVKFNILWVTDRDDSKMRRTNIVLRNYPHYLVTGTQKTSQGAIDWVQMDLADGSNFAIINQRYFDLEFGKTMVVVPFKDGSLRFLQLQPSIGPLAEDRFIDATKEKVEKFYEALKREERLIKLVQNTQVIDQ